MEIPKIGLGTWKLRDEFCTEIVKLALNSGYCHIDTATGYSNHKAIGDAIENFDRSKIFITSKINHKDLVDEHGNNKSINDIYNQICDDLNISYIDLILLHTQNVPFNVANDLCNLIKLKKLRFVGVSNFDLANLKIIREKNNTPIYINQIELHVPLLKEQALIYFKNEQEEKNYFSLVSELPEMINYCKNNNIILVAHRPLAKGLLSQDEQLNQIGKKYNKSASQVALRWLIQQGFYVIPKSESILHLKENLNLFDFELDYKDVNLISERGKI